MNDSVLIETSLWIDALRRDGRPENKAKVDQLIRTGRAAWCEMVLLELWNGARGEEERAELAAWQEEIILLPISAEVWKLSWKLARAARRAGLTVPNPDILIAACARFHEVPLEHFDEHFSKLDKLRLD